LGRREAGYGFVNDSGSNALRPYRRSSGEVKIGGFIMKYAVVEDGGKQYKAVEGGTIEVDQYDVEIGEQIDLDRVLLISDGDNVTVGTPYIDGSKVETTVVAKVKGPKVIIFKYKPKQRYRVKTGHRQKYIRLRIDSINQESGGKDGA
jgi:large subunit ribosomal protein L21